MEFGHRTVRIPMESFWEVFVFAQKNPLEWSKPDEVKRTTIAYLCNYSMFTPIIFLQIETRSSFFLSVGTRILVKTKITTESSSRALNKIYKIMTKSNNMSRVYAIWSETHFFDQKSKISDPKLSDSQNQEFFWVDQKNISDWSEKFYFWSIRNLYLWCFVHDVK